MGAGQILHLSFVLWLYGKRGIDIHLRYRAVDHLLLVVQYFGSIKITIQYLIDWFVKFLICMGNIGTITYQIENKVKLGYKHSILLFLRQA